MSNRSPSSVSDDADALFKKHSIQEMKEILVKLRYDADRKKSDLRIMVGERFRDVIDAAEAIRNMKASVEKLVHSFSEIKSLCEPSYLESRVKEQTNHQYDERLQNSRALFYPISSQIRLLVMTPETVWQYIERHDYVQASQVFHISRLIHASLTSNQNKLLSRFPVIQQQWDAISPLRIQIAEKANLYLSNYNVDDGKIVSASLAIMLLENSSLESGLDRLLSARKTAVSDFMQTLTASTNTESPSTMEDTTSFSKQLLSFVHIIISTLSSVSNLYLLPTSSNTSESPSNSQPQISRLAEALQELQAPRTEQSSLVKELYSGKENVSLLFRHLPLAIQRYSPRVLGQSSQQASSLTDKVVKEKVMKWVHDIFGMVESDIPKSLRGIKNPDHLSNLCSSLLEQLKQFELAFSTTVWRQLVQKESFSFWSALYKKGFTQRGTELVASSMRKLQESPVEILLTEIGKIGTDPKVKVLNLSLFQGTHGKSSSQKSQVKNQWVPANVQAVVSQFETTCKSILDDLSPFLSHDIMSVQSSSHRQSITGIMSRRLSSIRGGSISIVPVGTQSTVESLSIDVHAPEIREFIQTAFHDEIEQLQKRVLKEVSGLGLHPEETKENVMEKKVIVIDKTLYIGRCARGIAFALQKLEPRFSPSQVDTTTPTLHSTHRSSLRSRDKDNVTTATLSTCQQKMMDVCYKAYETWILFLVEEFQKRLNMQLRAADFHRMEQSKNIWEAVLIEGDDGASQLQMPVHASPFITHCLVDVVRELNRVGSYNLERPSLTTLVEELFSTMFWTFDSFVRSSFKAQDHTKEPKIISDQGAIQLLFDILYIERIGGAVLRDERSPKVPTKANVQDLFALIKSRIDPIDLTMIDSHIHEAVDRFYARTATLLGGILLLNDPPRETRRPTSVQEQPNVIALAGSCPRFPLLPISSGLASKSGFSRVSSSKTNAASTTKTSGTPSTSTPVESHAKSVHRPLPPIVIRMTRGVSDSSETTPRVSQSNMHSTPTSSGGRNGRVMGLVNAVTGNMQFSAAQQVRATELFSYISGVWGSSSSTSPSRN